MVPSVDVGLICGSSSNAISFPEDLQVAGLVVIEKSLIIDTPFGPSPEFVHFSYAGREGLTCRMHGWREGVPRGRASQQIFWVFHEAGVRIVLTEGGVGGISHLLKPLDVMIPHDYLDFSMRKDVSIGLPFLLTMRQPVCPDLAHSLQVSVRENHPPRYLFDRGVYVCTDGRHFESTSEVQMFKQMGGDVVGQSMCPEVYLAREIGAHYASVQLVVNHAEGVVTDWQHEGLAEIFHHQAELAGRILLTTMANLPQEFTCSCLSLRNPTMLRDKHGAEKVE